jgi:glutamine amidotransferase-like uncharacterized protein
MPRWRTCPRRATLLTALLSATLTTTPVHPLPEDAEEPRQPDAEAPGGYEFDLSTSGLGVLAIELYREGGVLWVRTGANTAPRALEAVPGRENAFSLSDAHEGVYELELFGDGTDRYARARLKNETLGIDAVGRRVPGGVHFPTLRERLMSRESGTETRNDLAGVRVALYFGRGMDEHSALALARALQWMGCDVAVVDADGVERDRLRGFHVFAVAGGETDPDPWGELGPNGKAIVRDFVRGGGGYVGICLGALFASSAGDLWGDAWGEGGLYLDLFPGAAHCGQPDVAPRGSWPLMIDLVVSDQAHPIAKTLPKKLRVVAYPNGPYFQPRPGSRVTVVARFAITGNPAMVASEYGKGRVFLSGPHPEIEVDSDRDGSTRFDQLSDEGSEWPLLLAAMQWITAR